MSVLKSDNNPGTNRLKAELQPSFRLLLCFFGLLPFGVQLGEAILDLFFLLRTCLGILGQAFVDNEQQLPRVQVLLESDQAVPQLAAGVLGLGIARLTDTFTLGQAFPIQRHCLV